MPQTAVFTADFSKWNAALANAKDGLKSFEVSAKGAQAQLQKMATAYSGAPVIKQLNLTAAAIEAVGGVTKLTSSEQQKANSVLQEGIEKYKVLGQEAPESIRSMAAELKKLTDANNASGKAAADSGVSFGKLAASYITAQAAIGVVKEGLGAVSGFLTSSLKSYADSEAAQKRLTTALQAQGYATPAVIGQFNKLADSMQRQTAFSDDATTAAEALLVQIGNVMPDQMDKAIKASADLAAGLGIGLEDAATLVGKTLEGNTGALGRYGVKLDEASVKAGGLDAVAKALNDRFGGQAAAQLETYAGLTQQLANDWDNLKEAVGGAIAQNEDVKAFLKEAPTLIAKLTGEVDLLVGAYKTWIAVDKTINDLLTFGTASAVKDFTKSLEDARAKGTGFFGQRLNIQKPDIELPDTGQLDKVQGLIASVTKHIAEQGPIADKAAAAMKSYAESVEELRKQISGDAAAAELQKLQLAWRGLSIDQQHDEQIVKRVLDVYNKLRPNLKQLPADFEHLHETYTPVIESAAVLNTHWEAYIALAPNVETGTKRVDNALKGLNLSGTLIAHTLHDAEGRIVSLSVQMKAVPFGVKSREIAQARVETDDWSKSLDDLAGSFAQLAQVSGGSFGGIVKAIGQIVASMSLANKAGRDLKAGLKDVRASLTAGEDGSISWGNLATSFTHVAAAAIAAAGAIAQATAEGSKAHRVLGGAAAGAEAGAAFGGAGAVVGAGIGALVGFYRAEQAAEKAADEARVSISQLGGSIQKTFGTMKLASQIATSFGVNLQEALARGGPEGAALLQTALDTLTAKQEHLSELLETYGIDWKKLGPAFQASHILQNVDQLNQDWSDLARAGVPLDTIIGSMAGKINDFLSDALKSGQKLPQQFQPILEQLIRMGKLTDENARKILGMSGEADVDFKHMEDVANKYGISLQALGPKFQAAKIHAAAQDIISDFQLLVDNGADVGGVLDGMSDEISALVQNAIKSGTALPDTMKPWIEQLLKSGKLVDGNGDKLTDLGGLQFEKPLTKAVDDLIAKLDQLIDKLGPDGVYGAIEKIPNSIDVGVHYTSDGQIELPDGTTIPNGPPPNEQHGGGSGTPSGPPPGIPSGPPAGHYAQGGIIRAQFGRVLPFLPQNGTDRVPVMATEGERYLSIPQTQRINRWLGDLDAGKVPGGSSGQASGTTIHLTLNVSALDGADVERVVKDRVIPRLKDAIRRNEDGLRTHIVRVAS